MIGSLLEKPLIRIDSEVMRRVRQHARAHMQTEVCGVLIGKLCDGIIEIEAPIEAFNASQAGAHVTFTQAAWETIYKVKDKEYPDDRIVGWYHSHPGFGVFLSDQDTFIHQNFFSSPDQVAWVYDPHSDEEGCFGWVDGTIRRIASIYVADSSGDGPQPAGDREAAAPAVPGVLQLQQRPATKQAPRLPVPQSRTRLLFRFSAWAKKAVAAAVHFRSWLIIPFARVHGRLRAHAVRPPSAPPRFEQQTGSPINLQNDDAAEQLPAGSGQ